MFTWAKFAVGLGDLGATYVNPALAQQFGFDQPENADTYQAPLSAPIPPPYVNQYQAPTPVPTLYPQGTTGNALYDPLSAAIAYGDNANTRGSVPPPPPPSPTPAPAPAPMPAPYIPPVYAAPPLTPQPLPNVITVLATGNPTLVPPPPAPPVQTSDAPTSPQSGEHTIWAGGVNPLLAQRFGFNLDLSSAGINDNPVLAPVFQQPNAFTPAPAVVGVPYQTQTPVQYDSALMPQPVPAPPPVFVPDPAPAYNPGRVYAGGSPGGPLGFNVTINPDGSVTQTPLGVLQLGPPQNIPAPTPQPIIPTLLNAAAAPLGWTPLPGEDPSICTGPSVINPTTGLPCDQLPPGPSPNIWTGPGVNPSPEATEAAYLAGQQYQQYLTMTGGQGGQGQTMPTQSYTQPQTQTDGGGGAGTTTGMPVDTSAQPPNPIWAFLNQTVFGIPYWMIAAGVVAWWWFGGGGKKTQRHGGHSADEA